LVLEEVAAPMDRPARDTQHVGLATAAAVVFSQLTGHQVDGTRGEETKALLNDVAHALSNIVPIYMKQASGVRRLSPVDLLQGRFERGAQVLRTRDGRELTELSVQRRDMLAAISVLRSAKARFG
jgi:hypothetical protein